MTYLMTQMALYMLCTFLLGLFLGWILWWRSAKQVDEGSQKRIQKLTRELDASRSRNQDLRNQISNRGSSGADVAAAAAVSSALGSKPSGIDGPRGGVADDLKRINGVGGQLEKLLHSMGFYHFDQIANWTEDEVTWVDDNLEGFKGRVTRDEWIAQAKNLAKQ